MGEKTPAGKPSIVIPSGIVLHAVAAKRNAEVVRTPPKAEPPAPRVYRKPAAKTTAKPADKGFIKGQAKGQPKGNNDPKPKPTRNTKPKSQPKTTHQTPQERTPHQDEDGTIWFPIDGGAWRRIDKQGRLLCRARNSRKEDCKAPAVAGLLVCTKHGALAPNARRAAKQRLADLVDSSISVLKGILEADGIEDMPKDADRLRAAGMVLDRTGHGPAQTIDLGDVKHQLYERMLAMQSNQQQPDDRPDQWDDDPEDE